MLDADWVMRELAHGPERLTEPAIGCAIQMTNSGACPAGPSLLALIRVLCVQKADAIDQATEWAYRAAPDPKVMREIAESMRGQVVAVRPGVECLPFAMTESDLADFRRWQAEQRAKPGGAFHVGPDGTEEVIRRTDYAANKAAVDALVGDPKPGLSLVLDTFCGQLDAPAADVPVEAEAR